MNAPTPTAVPEAVAAGPGARIVVGVDGSPSSIEALRWAARIAPTLGGAGIDAVSVWRNPPSYSTSMGMAGRSLAGDYQQIVDDAVNTAFGDTKPAGLRTQVYEGHPAKVLLDHSRDADVEMLVLGSRGHGGFVGLLIGSTSAYCAEHATCPVLVVHPATDKT